MKAIQSIRIVAAKGLLARGNGGKFGIRKSNETIGAPIGSAIPSDMMTEDFPDEDSSGSSELETQLGGLALLLAALGFYFVRKKKKKF